MELKALKNDHNLSTFKTGPLKPDNLSHPGNKSHLSASSVQFTLQKLDSKLRELL